MGIRAVGTVTSHHLAISGPVTIKQSVLMADGQSSPVTDRQYGTVTDRKSGYRPIGMLTTQICYREMDLLQTRKHFTDTLAVNRYIEVTDGLQTHRQIDRHGTVRL